MPLRSHVAYPVTVVTLVVTSVALVTLVVTSVTLVVTSVALVTLVVASVALAVLTTFAIIPILGSATSRPYSAPLDSEFPRCVAVDSRASFGAFSRGYVVLGPPAGPSSLSQTAAVGDV